MVLHFLCVSVKVCDRNAMGNPQEHNGTEFPIAFLSHTSMLYMHHMMHLCRLCIILLDPGSTG